MNTYLYYMAVISLVSIIVTSGAIALWPKYDETVAGRVLLVVVMLAAFAELEKIHSHPTYSEHVGAVTSHAWLYACIASLQIRRFWRFFSFNYHTKLSWVPKLDRRGVGGKNKLVRSAHHTTRGHYE